MDAKAFCTLARRLMSQPTAPYYEHAVRAEVEQICREHGLRFARDPYGNVLVRLTGASRSRTLVLAAHLDHPGFEIIRKLSKVKWLGRFRGGVPDNFFRVGTPLRLMPGNVPATLGPRVRQARTFQIRARERTLRSPTFAVWDME